MSGEAFQRRLEDRLPHTDMEDYLLYIDTKEHLDDEQIVALAADRVNEAQARRMNAHLEGCEECRRKVIVEEQFDVAFSALRPRAFPAGRECPSPFVIMLFADGAVLGEGWWEKVNAHRLFCKRCNAIAEARRAGKQRRPREQVDVLAASSERKDVVELPGLPGYLHVDRDRILLTYRVPDERREMFRRETAHVGLSLHPLRDHREIERVTWNDRVRAEEDTELLLVTAHSRTEPFGEIEFEFLLGHITAYNDDQDRAFLGALGNALLGIAPAQDAPDP